MCKNLLLVMANFMQFLLYMKHHHLLVLALLAIMSWYIGTGYSCIVLGMASCLDIIQKSECSSVASCMMLFYVSSP